MNGRVAEDSTGEESSEIDFALPMLKTWVRWATNDVGRTLGRFGEAQNLVEPCDAENDGRVRSYKHLRVVHRRKRLEDRFDRPWVDPIFWFFDKENARQGVRQVREKREAQQAQRTV